jgi:hypothetical protein
VNADPASAAAAAPLHRALGLTDEELRAIEAFPTISSWPCSA